MDLNQYRNSRLRRWFGFVFWALVFARVAVLLVAKLYFGAPFTSSDLILAVLGIGGGVTACLYLKVLLWPSGRSQSP